MNGSEGLEDGVSISLLASDFSDVTRLHDVLATSLPLPDYYGRNFDALFDVLTDLGAGVRFVISDPARAFELGGALTTTFCEVVQRAGLEVVFESLEPLVRDVDHAAFAAEWVDAWNARDLERILAHYAEDVIVTSPLAARLVPESLGTIRAKGALRAYWTLALAKSGALRFELVDVFSSAGAMVILYRNHRAERVTETLIFDNAGQVTRVVVAVCSTS